MHIERVLDLCVQLMKNGGKNKSVAFIILFSVHSFDDFSFRIFPDFSAVLSSAATGVCHRGGCSGARLHLQSQGWK